MIQERVIKFPDRAEAERFFNYPYAAIEESLCNAVYHKGYDVRKPIEVRILPDRIEIVSHPGADRSISEEGLRTYRVFNRRYRNRRIGDFLKEMHLTEGRGSGRSPTRWRATGLRNRSLKLILSGFLSVQRFSFILNFCPHMKAEMKTEMKVQLGPKMGPKVGLNKLRRTVVRSEYR